jgi:hypothetical protein
MKKDKSKDLMNEKNRLKAGHRNLAKALMEYTTYKHLRKEHIDNKRISSNPLLFGTEEHVTYKGHAGQNLISFLQNKNNK